MNYMFSRIFIGTLAENQRDGVYDQGQILCTLIDDDTVFDILNGEFYKYLGHENKYLAAFGEIYVIGIYEHFPKGLGNHIFRRTRLIEIAEELNKGWANIALPKSEVKTKKRK